MEKCEITYNNFNVPFLIIQGGCDKIVNYKSAFLLMENSPSKDKTLIFDENLWHCVWLEKEIN